MREPAVFHCTSLPYRFFGRSEELGLLNASMEGGPFSVIAFVGPGGQGKTAIVQHWMEEAAKRLHEVDGVFFWSFYRGKDSDLCLRELFAYAEGMERAPDVSASFCVDRLLPRLRSERWAIVLDGVEVVQHEMGSWRGRFVHPELGRLLEELASEPMPGVAVLTTRFELPSLAHRRHAELVSLNTLDLESACQLLRSLGVGGKTEELEAAARSAGLHAKAVELLGTFLRRYCAGGCSSEIYAARLAGSGDEQTTEEEYVSRVLALFEGALTQEEKDILGLATAFRQPPVERQFAAYLTSGPVRHLLHEVWGRTYADFGERPSGWVEGQVQGLVDLRLLERVGLALSRAHADSDLVLDAHPLVRRGFEDALGAEGRRSGATSRAGFLRGRPDRRAPTSLEEAREEVELFHAYCDAGLWNEADSTFVALENPKHRLVAPAFERDLLLRFFPQGDWRRPPLWSGFGRYRSLAICMEMLGQFEDAIEVYRPNDAALRGDALIALGRLQPILGEPRMAAPWQTLWQAYRVHGLALAGRTEEALRQAGTLVPGDIYEWVHLFEGLSRLGRLDLLDVAALKYRSPYSEENEWNRLSRERLLLDYRRWREPANTDLEGAYRKLMEAYDRAGLPWERGLVRLSLGRLLRDLGRSSDANVVVRGAMELAVRYGMEIVAADARTLLGLKIERGQ